MIVEIDFIMNASSTVISVNPSKDSEGLLNPEATSRMIRSRVLDRRHKENHHTTFRNALDGFFGIKGCMTSRQSFSLLTLRSAFAVVIAGMALTSSAPVFLFIAAGLLLAGFLTRITSLATGAFLIYAGLTAALAGSFEVADAMGVILCLVVAAAGPGRISVDTLLRRGIHHLARNSKRRQQKVDSRLSYKAFNMLHG